MDWEGPLWLPEGPNLLTFLPQALKNFSNEEKMSQAGFDKESRFLWLYYLLVYWNLTQRTFRQEFDPDYTGEEADYSYTERINPQNNPQGQELKNAVADVSLTGDIGKPVRRNGQRLPRLSI